MPEYILGFETNAAVRFGPSTGLWPRVASTGDLLAYRGVGKDYYFGVVLEVRQYENVLVELVKGPRGLQFDKACWHVSWCKRAIWTFHGPVVSELR